MQVYYLKNMELEVVSELFRGPANDAVVCRDRLSATGALYTLLAVRDRECARTLLDVLERSDRGGQSPCLLQAAQNEELLFLFDYREERRFSAFAPGQQTSPAVGEDIAIQLVMECLSAPLPWPLLYLVLEQDKVQIAKDNTVYFNMDLDLSKLDPQRTERSCVSSCAQLILELLSTPLPGGRRDRAGRKKRLKSFQLIHKKTIRSAYGGFPELYQDIRLTAAPKEKPGLRGRIKGAWARNRDWLFRLLLAVCVVLVLVALAMVVTQVIFGDIPWLRLFMYTFDVIGTENLHLGG